MWSKNFFGSRNEPAVKSFKVYKPGLFTLFLLLSFSWLSLFQQALVHAEAATPATSVYGQISFTTNSSGTSNTTLRQPNDTAVDASGGLYVADTENNRVLYFPAGSTTASRVYGQGGSYSLNIKNLGDCYNQNTQQYEAQCFPSALNLAHPTGVAVAPDGGLYIADSHNSRVLYYPAGNTTATRVYGQLGSFNDNCQNIAGYAFDPHFNRNICIGQVNPNEVTLNYPVDVSVDSDGGLYVSDSLNNRVLYYPAGSTTASRVYGQLGSFITKFENKHIDTTETNYPPGNSATNDSLKNPSGLSFGPDGGLYVADTGNKRVVYYPVGSTTASRIYHQNDTGQVPLSVASDVAVDSDGNLYIADADHNRVLYYLPGSTIPSKVYGQLGNLLGSDSATSSDGLKIPTGVSVAPDGGIYVTDSNNNRILYYPTLVSQSRYVVTNTNNSGPGSLRAAIQFANNNPDLTTITFNIASGSTKTIAPSSNLDGIIHPVIIDATSQPGCSGQPLIELSGVNGANSV